MKENSNIKGWKTYKNFSQDFCLSPSRCKNVKWWRKWKNGSTP